MSVDPKDPVVTARRDGKLADLLGGSLEPLLGHRLAHIGRTLNIIELGFGDEIAAPTPRQPDRRLSPHIFHCQCSVEINEHQLRTDNLGPHLHWLQGLQEPPVCLRVTADESGAVRMALAGGFLLAIQPDTDELIEHWRYFRPGELESHIVVYEEE